MRPTLVLTCGSSTEVVLSAPYSVTTLGAANEQDKADPQPVRGIDPSQVGTPAPGPAPTGDSSTTQATDTKPAAPQDSLAPCLSSLPLLIGMFALMYLLVIRPQQKQEKARRALLAAIKKGDKVVTGGGIHGEVDSIDERSVTLRCAGGEGVRIKFDRAAIARIVGADGEEAAKTAVQGSKT